LSHTLNTHETPKKKSALRTLVGLISGLTLLAGFCFVIFAIVGFARFSNLVSSMTNDQKLAKADGIVVLTGGKDRIEAAIFLLKSNQADKLLISGVFPKTSKRAITKSVDIKQELLDCCVEIDHLALNTIGNANQTRDWVTKNGFSRIIVVTSNYHIPRGMLEMRRAMPNVELEPYAVSYKPIDHGDWVTQPEPLKIMMAEYAKYIAASFRNDLDRVDRKVAAYAKAYGY